jgi:DNA-binding MarR family transcriptional regulator
MDREKLIQEIVNLGHRLGHHVRQHEPDAWMDLNLTISQVKSLFFINATGGTNFRKLAAALGRTPPDVTRIVDRLVGQGLVSRRENPEDRRMLMLHTTEAGKALVTRLHESRMSQIHHILEQLSDKELATLAEGLNAVARVLSNQTGEKIEEP